MFSCVFGCLLTMKEGLRADSAALGWGSEGGEVDGRLQRGDGGADWGWDACKQKGLQEEVVPGMRKIWIPVGKTN